MREKKEPFILGLNKESNVKHYHCPIDQGARMLAYPGEEGLYQCPICGMISNPSEVKADTRITSKFAVTQGKQIASGHNRCQGQKRYYDKAGHEINPNDKDVLFDLAQGRTIEYYSTTEDINAKEPKRIFTRR